VVSDQLKLENNVITQTAKDSINSLIRQESCSNAGEWEFSKRLLLTWHHPLQSGGSRDLGSVKSAPQMSQLSTQEAVDVPLSVSTTSQKPSYW